MVMKNIGLGFARPSLHGQRMNRDHPFEGKVFSPDVNIYVVIN